MIKVAQKLRAEGLDVNFAISGVDEFRAELSEFGVENPVNDGKYILGRGANDEKFKCQQDYS